MDILVCGDSHTRVFKYCNRKQKNFKFHVCSVGGATAQGIVNPNSKTNAFKLFSHKLKTEKKEKVIIMLGEVDCGFLIWVRSKKYGIDVDEQINISINNILIFIESEVIGTGYQNSDIIIAGSILPTIKDNTDKNFLNGLRSEVDVSQNIRTLKTLEFNNKLKEKCIEFGYHYIDISDYILGDNGLVKDEFLSKSEYDHHLANRKTHHLWLEQITKIIYVNANKNSNISENIGILENDVLDDSILKPFLEK